MKTKGSVFMYGMLLLFLSSCIRSFNPDIAKYEELLVVDGGITDKPGPYTVLLSKSSRTQEKSKFVPYTQCKVKIADNVGNVALLSEVSAGVYQTSAAAMQGVVGRKYRVLITTSDGDEYESSEEELLAPIGITSVYAEVQHKPHPKSILGRDGYQFYLDANVTPPGNSYLMWNLQSTYKFRADLSIYAYYANGKRNPVIDGDSLKVCYRTVDILDFFVTNITPNQRTLKRMPLNYEDNYTKALSIRYSLKVSQFTIGEAAYRYWSAIKKIRDEGGELYTQQPYQVNNNLMNKTNPEKPALGYFRVASVSENRIFVNHPQGVVDRYDICTLNGAPVRHIDEELADSPDLWPFFMVDPKLYNGDHWVPQECVDCRREGVLEKPVFWID